jgi:ThiF family
VKDVDRAALAARRLLSVGYMVEESALQGRPYLRITGIAAQNFLFEGKPVSLGLLYPPSSYFRPTVLLEHAILSRHNNVRSGELCVMSNESDAWDPAEHDECFLLDQARKLLADNESGPSAVAAGEVDAPEPISPQVAYDENTRVFLPDLSNARRSGNFEVSVSPQAASPGIVRTAVVTSINGCKDKAMLRLATMMGCTQRVTGQYIFASRAPQQQDLASTSDTITWCYRTLGPTYRKFIPMDSRLRKAGPQRPVYQAAMVVFDDEAVDREKKRPTALLVLEEGRGQQTTSCARTLYAPQLVRDYGDQERIPGCTVLGTKRVAIVGCGALGSMIAASLARLGVMKFVLVDPDVLQIDNLVRHDANLWGVGLGKAHALAMHLTTISVRAEPSFWQERFGGITDSRVPSRFEEVVNALAEADAIVVVTGDQATAATISDRFPDRLIIHAWVGGGAFGGRILVERADAACFECFRYSRNALRTLPDNKEDAIYPMGCGFPTFTGRPHDMQIVAQWTVKVVVANILAERHWTAVDNSFVVENQDGMIYHHLVSRHKDCRRHGDAVTTGPL